MYINIPFINKVYRTNKNILYITSLCLYIFNYNIYVNIALFHFMLCIFLCLLCLNEYYVYVCMFEFSYVI